jgi:hypothetical protein
VRRPDFPARRYRPPGHVWRPRPASDDWRIQTGRACSRRHCTTLCVAAVNRYAWVDGFRRDRWWGYCVFHLAEYGRWVERDRVWVWAAVRVEDAHLPTDDVPPDDHQPPDHQLS